MRARATWLACLGLALMLAGGGSAEAQDENQQSFLARMVSRVLSSPEGAVRIGAVDGPLSSDALIRDVEVSDAQGVWLRVDRIRFVWRRAALLSRRLEVDQLAIGRIEVLRRPVRTTPATDTAAEPLLPELPVSVAVAALTVADLVLGESIAGTAARLGIEGRASLGAPSEGLQAALSVKRLDGDGAADLRLAFVPNGSTLDLALRHREGPGGLIAHLLNIEGRPPVVQDLAGTGPLDAWRAQLDFSAGAVARAKGQATIARQGAARRIDLDVTGQLEKLLPPLAAPVFSGEARLSGRMTIGDDGALALAGLTFASEQAEMTVAGTLSTDRLLDVGLTARSRSSGRGAQPAISALQLDVKATGPMADPTVSGRLDADIVRLAAFAREFGLPVRGAARLSAEIKGAPVQRVIDASFALETRDLDTGHAQVATLLGPRATLNGKASLRGETVSVEAVTLKGRRIEARLDGRMAKAGDGGAGQARLTGTLDRRPVSASADFASLADGTIDLRALEARVASGTARGALKVARSGIMTGSLAVNVPDLSVLSAAAGGRLAGALAGDAVFTAPQGRQEASLKARGRAVSAFGAGIGSLTAEAQISGDLARPQGSFRADLGNVRHADLAQAGLARLDIKGSGRFAGDHAVIDATIGGGPQFRLAVKGAAPFSQAGRLGLAVTGQIDAALANARVVAAVQRVSGRIALDARVGGSYARPAIEGGATISNGAFVDLLQGTRLTGIAGRVHGAGETLRIDSLTAATPGGGRIAVSGTVQVDPGRGMPAQLSLKGENAQLISNGVVSLVAGLDLAVTGPLANAPLISGTVRVQSFDVTIPDRLPAGVAPLAGARHVSPPEQTRARLKAVEQERQRSARKRSGGGPRLDVRIGAPGRILVRGRGIDAELGGDIAVSGSVNAPRATGAFELLRGQFTLLTQRLEFSRGRLTFFGDPMPELDFVASTRAGTVTAKVVVTGPANAPVFALSSEPQLPPDEVMSRLMFERAVGNLSPLQALQLAQAVARLTGRGGPDVLDKVRQALGVDTLDVSDGKDGPTVGVSRTIVRGVRLGAKAGAKPEESGVTATIDLGRRIRLQGESNAGGRTTIGIGAEIEY